MSWYNPEDATETIPEGEYDAVVKFAEHGVSKSKGRPQCKVGITIYGPREIKVYDYLSPDAVWKIKQFAIAVGEREVFESGNFDPVKYTERNIRVKVKIEESDQYGDQNKIVKYLPSAQGSAPAPGGKATNTPRSITSAQPTEIDVPF